MRNMRFILRDAKPAAEARADSSKFAKRLKKKFNKGLKQPVDAYPGMSKISLISFEKVLFRWGLNVPTFDQQLVYLDPHSNLTNN